MTKYYLKYFLLFVLLSLLTACGDKCFEDVTFANNGKVYVTKSEQINVLASDSSFLRTVATIPQGSSVDITISGGPIYLCGKYRASVPVPANKQDWTTLKGPQANTTEYATAKDDILEMNIGCDPNDKGKKCSNARCNPNIQSVDCGKSPWSDQCKCTQNPPVQGCQVKTSGIVNPCQTSCETAQGKSCTYSDSDAQSTDCNQCKAKLSTCSYPNKKYYNSSSCIRTYDSGDYKTNLNQWDVSTAINQYVNTFCNSIKNGAFDPPSDVSNHDEWVTKLYKNIGINGQYTAPAQHCWYTAGMGLVVRIITDDDAQGCSDALRSTDQLTWFINNPISVNKKKLSAASQTNDYTLVRCAGNSDNIGFDQCLTSSTNIQNTIVQRTISKTPQAKYYCARVVDHIGDYGDNSGGYVVNITGQTCLAENGQPIKGQKVLGGLQYKASKDAKPTLVVGIGSQGTEANTYTINSYPNSSPMYFQVNDTYYEDNQGMYIVDVKWQELVGTTDGISAAIQDLRDKLRGIVFNNMPQYYCSASCPSNDCSLQGVCKTPYVQYIRAMLVLYIVFYGFAFIMGFVSISQKDLITRVLKIGLVVQLISPGSWEFFDSTLFSLFINGTDELIRKATFVTCGGDTNEGCPAVFSFIDNMFNLLFLDKAVWMKVLAMLFISPIGFVLGILLIIGMFYFLLGIISAITEYLLSIIAVAALLLLGPIFIPFILFEQTKNMFDTWIKMLFRYAMEPVFLVIGLSFLFEIYYSIFREMFEFSSCWKCMWGIEFPSSFGNVLNEIFKFGNGAAFLCFQGFGPWGMAPSGGGSLIAALGVDTSSLILLIVLSAVVRNYAQFVSAVMSELIGQRGSIWRMTGGRRQQYGSAGEAVLKSGPIASIEKKVGKAARTGAFRALGIKTEKDEEKELEAYKQSLIKKGAGDDDSGDNKSSSPGGNSTSPANNAAGASVGKGSGSSSADDDSGSGSGSGEGASASDSKASRSGSGSKDNDGSGSTGGGSCNTGGSGTPSGGGSGNTGGSGTPSGGSSGNIGGSGTPSGGGSGNTGGSGTPSGGSGSSSGIAKRGGWTPPPSLIDDGK